MDILLGFVVAFTIILYLIIFYKFFSGVLWFIRQTFELIHDKEAFDRFKLFVETVQLEEQRRQERDRKKN